MERLESLASDYFDGDLDARGAEELAAILRQDPGNRRWFLELYQQNRLLAVDLGSPTEEDLAEKVLKEIEGGDTGQFANKVMRTLEPSAPLRKRPRPAPPTRRPAWIRWMGLAAAAAVVLGLGWFFQTPPPLPPLPAAARVEKFEGVVSLGSGRSIRTGQDLAAGETLDTAGASSAAILIYPDRTRVELGGDSSLRLQQDPRGPQGKSLLLQKGFLRAIVSPQPPGLPLLVRSRFAEVRVVGTKFDFWSEPELTRVEVTEGKVRFIREGDSKGVDVGAGERAAATTKDVIRWSPVCDLDFTKMTALPPELEPLFCSSRVLHTKDRKIESGVDRIRFEKGLIFDPVPTPNRDHGLVVARWREEVGENAIIEAGVAAGPPWSLGFALSGDSFEGYRIIFAIRENPSGIMIDTIAPIEFKPLASDPRPIDFTKDHVLRAEKQGNRIRVWLDQELRLDVVVDQPLAGGRRRTFALSNYGESPVVRSLRVWKGTTP